MSSRERILARIREAVGGAAEPEPIDRNYLMAGSARPEELISRFTEALVDYRAKVQRVPAAEARSRVGEALSARTGGDLSRILVPAGFPADYRPPGLEEYRGPLEPTALDGFDGVVTVCAVAIAQTGSIVLDGGPGQGPRALSLIPDYHLCLVASSQIVELVPEAISALTAAVRAGQPITFISGPSATSDIELSRVEGVHGPRNLEVLIFE